MKVRLGFVSNSSSSSFICSIPYSPAMGAERVRIRFYDDRIREGSTEYKVALDEYVKIAEKYNLYIFDLNVDINGEDMIDELSESIPGFKILKEIY